MEKNLQKRMRITPNVMQVRENEDGSESRIIEGRAIVFNEMTTLWDGRNYVEREIIAPSCVTPDFLATQDVKLNLLHNRADTLCRNNKGVGTLNLEIRADGVYFSAEMPKCDIGDRALELVRNKTYTGCSFEFWPEEYTEAVNKLEDGRDEYIVTHTKFMQLDALTIAMDPAYESTSVAEREQYQKRENDIDQDREEKRAAEEAAKREAEKKTLMRFVSDMCEEAEDECAIFNRNNI